MLPFLKNAKKQAAGITMEIRKPDEAKEPSADPDAGLRSAALDLIQAVQANDEHGVMSALRSAFQILESQEDAAEPMAEPQE